MDCMRAKSADDVSKAAYETRSSVTSVKLLELFEPYGPYVDGQLVKGQPLAVFSRGNYTSKPIMLGTTTEETVLYVFAAFEKSVDAKEYLGLIAGLKPQSAAKIVEQYPPSLYPTDQRELIAKVSTDLIFSCSTRNLTRSLLSQGQNHIWLYVWDHAFSFKGWGPISWCEGRVCHGSEIVFVFGSAPLANFTFSAEEEILSGDVIAYWTNFAWSGDPNYSTPPRQWHSSPRADIQGKKLNVKDVTKWPEYSSVNNWTALRFKTPTSELISRYRDEDCTFWDTISYTTYP
ncbi:carboxylic ester hydrolase [Plakobranchus ocellatus]|uniref:Carboxylic ester hydrolase n=1 Tax=Plakobranchus ocellatus TaxID=259542 RepID=A0AAV4DHL1_9GAST|nr:carboxylic ester hydrolase [Plakobranchus ocellatus]